MTGFNAAASRTAIGLAVNLPQFRYNDTYQFQNNLTYVRGNHLLKAGLDVRRQYVKSFFFPTIRGLLALRQRSDVSSTTSPRRPTSTSRCRAARRSTITAGGTRYYFAQDEWRVQPTLTLNLGLRYELPGNNIQSLIDLNERILSRQRQQPCFR